MSPLRKKVLPVALLAMLPTLALGWGETGHFVVCQMAYDKLAAPARQEVERLIGLDPDFDNFAESCVFADTPERIRMFEHFMNVPRSYRAITTYDCPLADTCVFTGIRTDVQVLVDPAASDADKLLALKLLGHWVADIHQPLHVAFQDDRGANHIYVDPEDPDANLHGVWDSGIIAHGLGGDYRRIAARLRASITAEQREAWRHDSPVEWANESYQLTISPAVGYCARKQGACWYTLDNMLLDDGEPRRLMQVDNAYLEQHKDAVSRRLQQAALRLAEMLNRVFR